MQFVVLFFYWFYGIETNQFSQSLQFMHVYKTTRLLAEQTCILKQHIVTTIHPTTEQLQHNT